LKERALREHAGGQKEGKKEGRKAQRGGNGNHGRTKTAVEETDKRE
jgi:hypothetical protein